MIAQNIQNFEQQVPRLKVALVASDTALRASVRLLLTVSGMAVREFRTARDFLSDSSGPYACVVADWRLADMPACRLCRELDRRDPGLPVVVLAASPEALDVAGLDRKGIRVVDKPFNGDLLVETIAASVEHGPGNAGEGHGPREHIPAAS